MCHISVQLSILCVSHIWAPKASCFLLIKIVYLFLFHILVPDLDGVEEPLFFNSLKILSSHKQTNRAAVTLQEQCCSYQHCLRNISVKGNPHTRPDQKLFKRRKNIRIKLVGENCLRHARPSFLPSPSWFYPSFPFSPNLTGPDGEHLKAPHQNYPTSLLPEF